MTNKNTGRLQRRRQALFEQQGGLCHWCKKPMVPPGRRAGGRVARDECTLDHLFDRFDPRRQTPSRGEQRYVAACHLCNYKRGKAAEKAQAIEDLRRRSQRGSSEVRA